MYDLNEMKYRVEVLCLNDVVFESEELSKEAAIALAKAQVFHYDYDYEPDDANEEDNYQVYITKSDGQHGYLNRDGSHTITGQDWRY